MQRYISQKGFLSIGVDIHKFVQMTLLDEATKSEHSYYNLISGVDYPLKSRDYIYNYFQDHFGCEFIRFDMIACREHDMALYLLQQKKKIKHLCHHGLCADEIFL